MTVWRARAVSEVSAYDSKRQVHQGVLHHAVTSLFPNQDILHNARKQTALKNEQGNFVELDLFIPKYNICFEFQDIHHYASAWYSHRDLATIQYKDNRKKEMVLVKGDTIIQVPCWWNGSTESLAATISFDRPDLISNVVQLPIPLNPSEESLKTMIIPGVGELMLASFPEDKDFTNSISVQNSWWMGEKFDGVRFCWNPHYHTVYTRRGLALDIIPSIIEAMPSSNFVDGEIWLGRGLFPEAQKLVKVNHFFNWDFLRMVGFDEPSIKFEKKPFEKRYAAVFNAVPAKHPFLTIAARLLCTDKKQITKNLQDTVQKGGEGIILRKVRSLYERGRSLRLFKLKVTRGDGEAIVLRINEDKSVELKLPDGIKFTVTAQNIKIQAKKGDIVTFSYDDYSRRAAPVNPIVYQVRQDLSWDDVMANFQQDSQQQIIAKPARLAAGFTEHPFGYWTAQNGKNMRMFLEDYARSKKLDPLLPETWYNISWKEIKKLKGSNFVQHYSGSYIKSLFSLFPEIKLDESKFRLAPKKLWLDVAKRRQLFIRFAQFHKFDALVAENWYSIRPSSLSAFKGGKAVLAGYKAGNMRKALVHLFPDIGLDESQFVTYPKNHFLDTKAQKEFFLWFAKKRGFNPLIPENWYPITQHSILPYKGARIILKYYSGEIANALLALFPDIGLQKNRFFSSKLDWDSTDRRQNFFLSYATRRNFSPLIPENWYSVTATNILAFSQNAKIVLGYYASLSDALIHLFPNLNLDKSKFLSFPDNYWTKAENRRKFFEYFAKNNVFDPLVPDNWYSVSKRDILTYPGAKFFLLSFSGSVIKALLATFPDINLEPKKFLMLPRNFLQVDANKRKFFVKLAQKYSFDPNEVNNWYNFVNNNEFPRWAHAMLRPNRTTIPPHVAEKFKGMESVMEHHKANVAITLFSVFPTLNWEVRKFSNLSSKYWNNINNKKAFFEKFAHERGFDPLLAANWYNIKLEELLSQQDAQHVMESYSNNAVEAIVSLFPELKLKRQKFFPPPPTDKRDPKSFFTSIAEFYQFDSLVPENWYNLPRKSIIQFKGARGVLSKDNSYVQLLMSAFPDIGLQEIRFSRVSRNYWLSMENRKRVFDDFAKQHKFDPYRLSNWYQRPIEKLLLIPGVNSILCHYDKNIHQALAHIYGQSGDT